MAEYEAIDEILDEIEEKYTTTDEEEEDKKKPAQFWIDLEKKLKDGDVDHIKKMVKNKELKMDEVDSSERNLLMIAAYYGSFELVSMAINLGADIDKEDNNKQTALKIAKQNGYPDIEEILIMNQLKTELGERIENTTKDISRKQGVTANFIRILNEIFSTQNAQHAEDDKKENFAIPKRPAMSNTFLSMLAQALSDELLETLLSIMIKSIEQKVAYSNDMLHISFYYEVHIQKRAPKQTLLYSTIKHCVLNILADTKNKKDWFWLKDYILNASIWYFRVDPNDDKSQYLWYDIFKWVQDETEKQSKELSKPMKQIENKNTSEWDKLIHYTIDTDAHKTGAAVRQDTIEGGLKSQYTKEYLTQNVSLSGAFNPFVHYDLSQYLTKLVLICHEADDHFQNDVQDIFGINKETKQNKDLQLLYMRGPVKKYDRCYAKVMGSYRDEKFPTAAHILDIVRCSFVFADISSLLCGMDLFQKKIAESKYCIATIARIKNGFAQYSHDEATYTDIKFNVVIKGKEHNIVGEIQFLIKDMFDYKKIAHSLYSIERTKEFADGLSQVLPLKLDLEKQLFIHAARNNINGFTDLMIAHDFHSSELLQLNQRNQSILTPVCALNCEKVFNYLVKEIPHTLLRERLIFPDHTKAYPLLKAIENNHYHGVLYTIFNNDRFNLIQSKDSNQESPLDLCWKHKKGKCALLILRSVQKKEDRLKLIEYTGPETTALQNALLSGEQDVVTFILDELTQEETLKAKLLRSIDSKQQTNWHYAVQGGSVECLKILLKHCDADDADDAELKSKLWSSIDVSRRTPLFHAVINAKAEMTDFLLTQLNEKEKANFFDKPSLYGKMPIDELMKQKTKEHFDTLKVVAKHLAPNDKHLGTLFLFAAQNDEIQFAQLLIDKSTDHVQKEAVLNYLNSATQCPLSECCVNNNTAFLEYLLSELGDNYDSFVFKSSTGRCALMEAASKCYVKVCRLILRKIHEKDNILRTVLSMKDSAGQTALVLAINSSEKNNEKCAKLILRHYDLKRDSEDIFLACLQLSDIEMTQAIWNNTNGDRALQNKLLRITNKDEYNCFLLVCENGNYECLAWLLTLNDHLENEDEEDEKNLMQKHQSSGKTPLLLCVANDKRKKPENEKQKVLTKEEQDNYFKCTKLIFDKVSHTRDIIMDRDKNRKNALHYACENGNVQTVEFLLSKLSDKDQNKIIDEKDSAGCNVFVCAVNGGSLDLVQKMYTLYEKYDKLKALTQNGTALQRALVNGYEDIVEWILFELIKDSTQKLKYLNSNLSKSKSGRCFEEKMKAWLTNILDKEVKLVHDVRDIVGIFTWVQKHPPIDQFCVKLILEKISKDEYSKSTFIKQSNAMSYACQQNQFEVLQGLLTYLETFSTPLFEGVNSVLVVAINARSNKCVELILNSITDKNIKNRLIEACNKEDANALIRAIDIKSESIIHLIFNHHSNIECILGDAFIHALDTSNADLAKQILYKAKNRSNILNHRAHWGRTALNIASSQKTPDCLNFVVNELKLDLEQTETQEEEKKTAEEDVIHPLYTAITDAGRNIFHWMFTKECTLQNIRIVESVLPKTVVRRLLLARCLQGAYFPIHYACEKSPMDVVKWLISQFDDDPLQQFKMLCDRTEYSASLVAFGIRDKAIKKYLSDTLLKCLKQIEFQQIDIMIIKDIFYYTTSWECVELQQLIIDNVPKAQHAYLFNKDDILHHWGHVLHEVIRSDDEALGKLFVSTIPNVKSLMVRDTFGLYLIPRGLLQGSVKVLKLILDRLTQHKDLLLKQIVSYDQSSYNGFFYAWHYKRKECAMQVVSYLGERGIHRALNEACKCDKELTIIPALLDVIQDDKIKTKLLCQKNDRGDNMLHVALGHKTRKAVEFISKRFPDDIKDGEDSVFTAVDKVTNTTVIATAAMQDDSYSGILEAILLRLSPSERFKHLLRKNFAQGTVLTYVVKKKDMEKVCNKILCQVLESMNVMNDVDKLAQLFVFCCESKNMQTLNMVLSKTAAQVKTKLFMNYNKNKTFNIIKTLIHTDKEKKEMLFALLKIMESKAKIQVLNDSANPNHLRTNALIHTINTCDMECYNAILSEYAEQKEDCAELLKSYDHNHKNALYFAVKSSKDDIVLDILQRIKDETEIMSMLNAQTTDDDTNIFALVTSSKVKSALKKLISTILANVKQNGLSSASFYSYFKWLCKNNEIDDVKTLIDTFKHQDKDYVHKLLKYVSGTSRKGALHTVSANNYYELLEYLLSFIRTDQQKEDYLLTTDATGNNPLLLSCASDATECIELLINCVKSNQTILSQMILCKNTAHHSCIEYEIAKTKLDDLRLMLECSNNALIVKRLFIVALKYSRNEFAETVLQKAQSLKLKLFDHLDSDGCIPLFHALSSGNTKFAQIILNEIDKENDAMINYLAEYKTYAGESLLHAACKSTNINAAKLLMNIFQFQKARNHLLFGTDNKGNIPLQVYFGTVPAETCGAISEFVLWYLSNIKTNKEKLALVAHSNLSNISTLDHDVIKKCKFGATLFKRIISSIDCSDEQDIASWATILQVAIQVVNNTVSLVQYVINKYHDNKTHIMQLLASNNHLSQNSFYNVAANAKSRSLLKYMLQFVNSDTNHLLIEANFDGNTALHQVIPDAIRGRMILEKFDVQNSGVLFIKNDNNLSILDKARSCAPTLTLCKQINETQLVQLYVDNVTDKKLFCYFWDHEDELMPKLLRVQCSSNCSTWLMEVVWMTGSKTARHLFRWTIDWIRKLSDDEKMKLLSRRNLRGQTALHYAAFYDEPELIESVLSLYPTQEAKEGALLTQTYEGITPFHRAYASVKSCSAQIIWNNMKTIDHKLRIMNTLSTFWRNSIDSKGASAAVNWKQMILNLFNEMKDQHIKDVILLIPFFYFAIVSNDIQFANRVASKVDPQDAESVLSFVTTKIPAMKDENCLHFAAYSKQSAFMLILVNMIENIKHDHCNKKQETPLSIACKKGNLYVVQYILNTINNKEDKAKLIAIEWKHEVTKTIDNYKRRSDYQIGLNCIATCALFKRFECLKELLSNCSTEDIQSIIRWKNSKKQTIYHFIKNVETCKYLKTHFSAFTFGMTTFNVKDVDGMTPFMQLIKASAKLQFIEWILEQCANNKEKLQFIYNANEKGENALELAGAGSIQQLFMIQTIKQILVQYKTSIPSHIDMMIAIFLDALRSGNIDLAKWLMSLLRKDSYKKKLINCVDQNGLNGVLFSCKGGQIASLQYLLAHRLFDAQLVFKTDKNGLTPLHYACYKNSIACFAAILSLYKENFNGKKSVSELLFITDTFGNIPFDYIVRKSTISYLCKWIIAKCFDDDDKTAKRKRMEMLFGNKNKKMEVSLCELMLRQTDVVITQCIKEYFDAIECVEEKDILIVGNVLMYLQKDNWNLCKYIVSKIKDKQILSKVLMVESSDGYNVLLYVAKSASHFIIRWWIDIISENHPIFCKQEKVSGKTALALLMDKLSVASVLLNKITDKKQRLKLIHTKDIDNKSILDEAKEQNIPNRIEWIQQYLN